MANAAVPRKLIASASSRSYKPQFQGFFMRTAGALRDGLRAGRLFGLLRDLTFLELFFPVLVAGYIWNDLFINKSFFWCDYLSVVRIVNRQTSCSERVTRLVHELVITCLKFNITFSAKNIGGVNNDVADVLSRFQEERFRVLAEDANQHLETFPAELLSLVSDLSIKGSLGRWRNPLSKHMDGLAQIL